MQRIVPVRSYEDVAAAADWLQRAFGFAEGERFTDDEGRVTHVNLEFDGNVVMLGPIKRPMRPRSSSPISVGLISFSMAALTSVKPVVSVHQV